jgi:hypothetical protein
MNPSPIEQKWHEYVDEWRQSMSEFDGTYPPIPDWFKQAYEINLTTYGNPDLPPTDD